MGYRRLAPLTIADDPATLAYIAGIIDGEGSIGITSSFDKNRSRQPSHSLRLTIVNTDARLMCWLSDRLSGGLIEARDMTRRAGWKQAYSWTLHGPNAEQLLRAVLPYLVLKREQAEVGIQLRELHSGQWRGHSRGLEPGVVDQREALKRRLHVLNARGRREEVA